MASSTAVLARTSPRQQRLMTTKLALGGGTVSSREASRPVTAPTSWQAAVTSSSRIVLLGSPPSLPIRAAERLRSTNAALPPDIRQGRGCALHLAPGPDAHLGTQPPSGEAQAGPHSGLQP